MLHGPKTQRSPARPLGADFSKPPPGPEPRLQHKDVNNPPIVTIFGAGIAGLTAAHELIDRGFLVQVIEAKRDAYARGRPQVGGMAATQYARVRANVEDLHPDLLSPEVSESKVGQWLLRLLGFNRLWWLQTERPEAIHSTLYERPRFRARTSKSIGGRVVECLRAAKARYRDSWIWDLVVRSVLIDSIRDRPERDLYSLGSHENALMDLAWDVYSTLKKKPSAYDVAKQILSYEDETAHGPDSQRPPPGHELGLPELPKVGDLANERDLISTVLEREFLCFRLVPYAIDDYGSANAARKLLASWQAYFAKTDLGINLLAVAKPKRARVHRVSELRRNDDGQHPAAWLEIEIVEHRLPGEHGFRFFPSFYRHLDDTLRRIPLIDCCERATDRTVYDNLRPTTIQAIGVSEKDRERNIPGYQRDGNAARAAADRGVEITRSRPMSFGVMRDRTDGFLRRLGCKPKDALLFSMRMLRFMTSCTERRRDKYEEMSWAHFIGVKEHPELVPLPYSDPMKAHIEAAAQCVLALSAAEADARTYGDATVQLYQDMLGDGSRTDRTLNGPSSDALLEPWREHLERQGVRFFLGRVTGLERQGDDLVPLIALDRALSQSGHALLEHDQAQLGRSPDFYVMALDLDAAHDLISPLPIDEERAPEFAALKAFRKEAEEQPEDKALGKARRPSALKNMSGVQFFFDSKASIGRGHTYYPYSEWGLSSISQSEFWSRRGGFSDGYLGVLSVDVSRITPEEKEEPPGRSEQDFLETLRCGAHRVGEDLDDRIGRWWAAREIWGQLRNRVPASDELPEPRVFHVDENIGLGPGHTLKNETPYLIARPGMFKQRPGHQGNEIKYRLAYDRWAMCGTFMATHTRMTSMESANESARHAVQAILRAMHKGKAAEPRILIVNGVNVWVDVGPTEKYNGVSERRKYDQPDIWPLEQQELEDLEFFKQLDKQLHAAGLGHFMDICDLDRRIKLACELAELDQPSADSVRKLVELTLNGVEASMRQATGPGHPLHPHVSRLIALIKWFAELGPAPQ